MKNQTNAQHRQIIVKVGVKQLRVNEAHSADHDGSCQSLPEGAEDRSAITKLHVLLRQRRPEPALAHSLDKVGHGKAGASRSLRQLHDPAGSGVGNNLRMHQFQRLLGYWNHAAALLARIIQQPLLTV
jgi:hypothetical protein